MGSTPTSGTGSVCEMKAPFLPEQFARYQRHLNLPEFGADGQRALLDARVLLVGAGGLGCPLALYLAAAGVGHLGLLDFDVVELSNLQRQVLYGSADVGKSKARVARERVRALNPDVRVTLHETRLRAQNALEIFAPYDLIVDGSDNFPTRYLTNDAAVLLQKPSVYGAILRFEGQASSFDARRGPCYRCLFPAPPPPEQAPSCAEAGVLGVLPGLVAMVQATEAVKLLTGIGEPLLGRLLHYDALAMRFREFRFEKDPACALCGETPSVTALVDYENFCGVPASAGDANDGEELSADALRALRTEGEEFLLLDVREPEEFATAHISGARLLPLAELEARLAELAAWKARRVVVHCHTGGRSAKACALLRAAGFENVANLQGGIEAWSLTVDPKVPRY